MFSTARSPLQAIIYPLELIKTRLAVSPAGSYTGIAHCAAQVLRHEGWRSFYRGMLPSMVRPHLLSEYLYMLTQTGQQHDTVSFENSLSSAQSQRKPGCC